MSYPEPPKRRSRKTTKIVLGVFGGLVALIVVAGIVGGGAPSAPTNARSTSPATLTPGDPGSPAGQPVAITTTAANTPSVSPQEQQAIGAAQDYLNISAFSRQGLIDQLSSSAGDGYPVDVATAAVDSLNEDWNAQAVKSAQAYLQLTHFSCNGLIDQLDSSAGEKFTKVQAAYGAHQTSACG